MGKNNRSPSALRSQIGQTNAMIEKFMPDWVDAVHDLNGVNKDASSGDSHVKASELSIEVLNLGRPGNCHTDTADTIRGNMVGGTGPGNCSDVGCERQSCSLPSNNR